MAISAEDLRVPGLTPSVPESDMREIADMASRGMGTIIDNAAAYTDNYNDMKSTMKATYSATPFGPLRKKHYSDAIDRATHRVDAGKWALKWGRKMAR